MLDYDNVLTRQRDIAESIRSIEVNFKKDSESRKTDDYLRARLKKLETLWEEFEKNNVKLLGAPDKNEEYYVDNVYQKVQLLTDQIRTMITTHRSLHEEVSKTDDSKITELFNEQKANFRAFQRILNNIDVDSITEKWELEDELRNLQMRWNNIDNLHLKIDNILMGTDKEYEDRYSVYEKKYRLTKKALNQKISATTHLHQSTPKMEIPTFYGDYSQWPTFLDLYKSAIHDNPVLSRAQKMQHLKGKLRGEAQRLIQHLHVSADNYLTAWDLLYHRYNNDQLLFSRQIEIFLNQPTIHKQSSHDIKKLHDTTMECVHAIHNLGIETTTWDPLLVHLLTKKLDPVTLSDYKESRKTPRSLPTLEEFTGFLETKFTALEPVIKKDRESAGPSAAKQLTSRPKESFFSASKKTSYSKPGPYNYSSNVVCVLCNDHHALYQCKKFECMSPDVKLKTVAKHGMCKNCLYVHERNICNSTKTCKICHGRHNTLLHDAVNETTAHENRSSSVPKQQPRQQYNRESSNHVTNDNGEILLTTVLIRVRTIDNTYITLRGLLDQGSQITLITENAAQRLGLPRLQLSASVTGVGINTKRSKGKISLECKSIHNDYTFTTDALIMPKLINNLPNNSFEKQNYEHLESLQLADPDYNLSKSVDILLDAKVYSDIIMSGLFKGSERQPVAQQTKLGWILSGSVNVTLNCNVVINNINEIASYWEMEEISNEETSVTNQERFCEELYTNTTRRLPDGRYEVRLPMKEGFETKLGQSKPKAIAQFNHLEQRLTKNNELRDSYQKFMKEYLELGHMKECNTGRHLSCFLPHHGVHKVDSTTTKLRVVFNASSRTTSGHSLNDLMECGTKMQQDIQDLLMRWRTYEVVYTADCEKMYRCILLQQDQQHLQKIVWRDRPQDLLKEYALCTLTYGMKASPYLAMRTMAQLAIDDADKYPLAAKALEKDFYVDDLLSGCHTIQQAQETQQQLIDMLRGAGINLRKWASNKPELLSHLSPDQINQSAIDIKNITSTTKALGLQWSPITDTFTFHYGDKQRNPNSKCTKRILLSEISKIFDPLGWLSPVTIKAKLLFQQVWLTGTDWDDEVPQNIQNEWFKVRDDLHNIDKLQIPRCIGNIQQPLEIHGFCDASEKAYACVIYFKSKNDKGEIITRIIASKTKLAPKKKPLTLPRLELSGALLLSKLMAKTIKAFPHENIPVYGWCDSLIVLGWLKGNATRWKLFVENRVNEIIAIMPSECWGHVSSQNNAADCATRGITATQLNSYSLWWEGGDFIKRNIPKLHDNIALPECEVKRKPKKTCTVLVSSPIIEELLDKYSSLSRIVRIICYVSRFITNLCHRRPTSQRLVREPDTLGIVHDEPITSNYLTTYEIENAYNIIAKVVQRQEFQKDIMDLKEKGAVSVKSDLLDLHPYLDKKGVLRVGGRLQHAHLPENAKHPIILPKRSKLTDLSVSQAHLHTLHGTVLLTLVALRQRFWVLGATRTVKKHVSRCVKCVRFNARTRKQLMGDLPEPRVTPSRAFTHTGIDFTGQVEVKANKGRGIKTTRGYIAVFVCLATKAIHLELASDLSTETFLAAFKRMTSRRGSPLHVYTDNGTNFVGASRILRQEQKEILKVISKDFLDEVAVMGVTWHFNAPAWPTGCGFWEAAVKSTKHHLKRVLGDQKLTFEEFSTALTENSETEFLTPGHFLIRGPLISLPSSDKGTCIKTRWQLTEKMVQAFWKKWSTEYLHNLQLRSKWQKPTKNLTIDDVVLIKDDNLPPARWAMGRITAVHPGKDGYVRVVTLKTKGREIQRPVLKLVPLPVAKPEDIPSIPTTDTSTKPESKSQKPATCTRRPRRNCITSILLLLLTCVLPTIQTALKINKIQTNNTLYFDKISDIRIIQDEWKMVAYYNMTTYWNSIAGIESYVHLIKTKCNNDNTCSPVIAQLEHELNELRHYNDLLTNRHNNRQRRGLVNGIGYLANTLFGVLDDRFAEKYEKDIETVQKREDHLFNLYKNQTSILEAHNNILKRNELIMKNQFNSLAKTVHNLTDDINQAQSTSLRVLNSFSLLSSMVAADVIISNLRRIQDTLVDTVTDIYHGRLNVHLLPPEQIQQQLNLISGHLQNDLTIPVDNIGDIYGLLRIQARVTFKSLIMEIRLPLLNREQFELNKIIDIPREDNNRTIYTATGTKYIAINVKKDTVIPMTETDILSCITHKKDNMFCPLNHLVYTMKVGESICDMQLMINKNNKLYCTATAQECADRWIKLHARDAWLFSCCGERPVRVICPDSVFTEKLSNTGIVVIPFGCAIRGKSFVIHSQHDYNSQIVVQGSYLEASKISPINDVIRTSLPKDITLMTEGHDFEFADISKKIKAMKEEQLEPFSRKNNIHYIIIYSILSVIVLTTLPLLLCQFRRRWQLKPAQPDIPLQEVTASDAEAKRAGLGRMRMSTPLPQQSLDDENILEPIRKNISFKDI